MGNQDQPHNIGTSRVQDETIFMCPRARVMVYGHGKILFYFLLIFALIDNGEAGKSILPS